jgi:hypothetical protein
LVSKTFVTCPQQADFRDNKKEEEEEEEEEKINWKIEQILTSSDIIEFCLSIFVQQIQKLH